MSSSSAVSRPVDPGRVSEPLTPGQEVFAAQPPAPKSSAPYSFSIRGSTISAVAASSAAAMWEQATRDTSLKHALKLAVPAAGMAYLAANHGLGMTPSLKDDMKFAVSALASIALERSMPSPSGLMGTVAAAAKGGAIGAVGCCVIEQAPRLAGTAAGAARNWWRQPSTQEVVTRHE